MEPFLDNDASLYFDPKGLTNLNSLLESTKDLQDGFSNANTESDFVQSPEEVLQERTEGGEEENEGEDEDNDESQFAVQWMSAVGRGMMSLYLQKIMEIPSISDEGAKQLEVDISYICKVLSIYEVPIDRSLEMAQKYLALPRDK